MPDLLLCTAGRVAEACLADARAAPRGRGHLELALEIADVLADRDDGPAVEPGAVRAADHYATRVLVCAVPHRWPEGQG
jgi:hypothetical protein